MSSDPEQPVRKPRRKKLRPFVPLQASGDFFDRSGVSLLDITKSVRTRHAIDMASIPLHLKERVNEITEGSYPSEDARINSTPSTGNICNDTCISHITPVTPTQKEKTRIRDSLTPPPVTAPVKTVPILQEELDLEVFQDLEPIVYSSLENQQDLGNGIFDPSLSMQQHVLGYGAFHDRSLSMQQPDLKRQTSLKNANSTPNNHIQQNANLNRQQDEKIKITIKVHHILPTRILKQKLIVHYHSPLSLIFNTVALKRSIDRSDVVLVFNSLRLFATSTPWSAGMKEASILYSYTGSQYIEIEQQLQIQHSQILNSLTAQPQLPTHDELIHEIPTFSIRIKSPTLNLKLSVQSTFTPSHLYRLIFDTQGVTVKGLYFDGERIGDEETLGDVGVEGGDMIEVK